MSTSRKRHGRSGKKSLKKRVSAMAGAVMLSLAFNAAAQGNDAPDTLSPYQQDLKTFVAQNEKAFANVRFFFLDQQKHARLENNAKVGPYRDADRAELERAYRDNASGYGIDLSTDAVRKALVDSYEGLEHPENPFPEHMEFLQSRAIDGNGLTVFVETPDNDNYAGHCFIVGANPYVTDSAALMAHAIMLDDNITLPPAIKRATLDRFIANEELGHCGHLGRLHDANVPGSAQVKSLRAKADPDTMGMKRYRILGEGTAMAFSLMKTMRETGDVETLRFIRNGTALYPMLNQSGSMFYDMSPVIQAAWDFATDPANRDKLKKMSAEELLDKAEEFSTALFNSRSDAQMEKQHAMLGGLRKMHDLHRKNMADIAAVLEKTEFPADIAAYKTAFLKGWADMQAQGVHIRDRDVPFDTGQAAYRQALQKVFNRLANPQTGQAADKDKRLVYLAEYRFRSLQARWGESAVLHKTITSISNGGGDAPEAMRSYFSGREHGDWFNAADKRDIAMAGALDKAYEAPEFERAINFDVLFEEVAHAALDGQGVALAAHLDRADKAMEAGKLGRGEVQSLLDEALTQAATGGHAEVVVDMITRGAHPGAFDALGLQWAAANGHGKVVDVLLKHANRIPVSGLTEAQDWAASEGRDDIAARISRAIQVKACAMRPAACSPGV